jgi:putative hydrolase of the HAD superfamily
MTLDDAAVQSCAFASPPQLVLFDLDDTLGDYATARASRLRRAFQPHLGAATASDPEAMIEAMIAESIKASPHGSEHFPGLFRRFGIDAPEAARAAALWYRTNRFYDLRLFADAIATLTALRTFPTGDGLCRRRRLGIVTNGPADVQRDKIDLLGIRDFVDFIVISGELGAEKPDPRIYAEALKLGGATAEETVFVGDAPLIDILGAKNAGMRSIWVNRTGEPWSIHDHAPTCEVTDLTSVVALLGTCAERVRA